MMVLFVFLFIILYKFIVTENFNKPHNETRYYINDNMTVKNQENIQFFVSLDGSVVPCDLEKNKKRLNTQKYFGNVLIDINGKKVECLKDSNGLFVFFMIENRRIPIFSYIVTNESTYFIFENEKKSYVYLKIKSNKKLSEACPKFQSGRLNHNYYVTNRCGLIKILENESVEEYATCMIKQDNKIPLLRDKNGSCLRLLIDENGIPHTRFCFINNIVHLVFLNQNDENVYFFLNEEAIYQQNMVESDTLFFEDFEKFYYDDKKIINIFNRSACFNSPETVSFLKKKHRKKSKPSKSKECDQVQNQRFDNSEDKMLKKEKPHNEKLTPRDQNLNLNLTSAQNENEEQIISSIFVPKNKLKEKTYSLNQNENPNLTKSAENEDEKTIISLIHFSKNNFEEKIDQSYQNVDASTKPKIERLGEVNRNKRRHPKFISFKDIEIGKPPQNEQDKPEFTFRGILKNTPEAKNKITSQKLEGLKRLSPHHASEENLKRMQHVKILGLQYENSTIQTKNEQEKSSASCSNPLKKVSQTTKILIYQDFQISSNVIMNESHKLSTKSTDCYELSDLKKKIFSVSQEYEQKKLVFSYSDALKNNLQATKKSTFQKEESTLEPTFEKLVNMFEKNRIDCDLIEKEKNFPTIAQGQKRTPISNDHKKDSGVRTSENSVDSSLDLVFNQNIKKIYLDHQMRNLLDPKRSESRYTKTMNDIKEGFEVMKTGIITTHDNMKNGPLVENQDEKKHQTNTDETRKTTERTFSQNSRKILTDQEIQGFESNISYNIFKNVNYEEYEKQGMWVLMNEIMKTETGYKWLTVTDQKVLKMFYHPPDCKNIYKKLDFQHPNYKKYIFYKYEYKENKKNTTIIRSGLLAIGENVKLNGFKYNGPVIVDHNVEIKQGVIINNGTYVGPYCTIGNGCYIGSGCYFEKKVSICPHVSIKNRNYFHENAVIGYHTEDTKINKDINKLIESKNQLFFDFDTIIGSGNIFGRYCKLHRGSHVYFYNYIGANVILHPAVRIYMNNTILWKSEILKDSIIGIGNNIFHHVTLDKGSNIGLYTHIFSYDGKIERYYMRGCAQIKCYIHSEELATEGHTTTNRLYRVNLSNTIIKSLGDIEKLIIYENIPYIKRIYILLDDKLDMRSLI